MLSEAGREFLGTHRRRTTAHPLGDALVDEHVEVTPDRHLAHVELAGELGDAHPTIGVEAMSHQLQPFECLDVHRGASCRSPSVARALRTFSKTPNATP